MLQRRELSQPDGSLWVDIVDPSKSDLAKLAEEFKVDLSIILVSLDPEHLPKFERIDGGEFIILRVYDVQCQQNADTTQELTRKVAIFISANRLLTIHRTSLKVVDGIFEKMLSRQAGQPISLANVLLDLFRESLNSYDGPLDQALNDLEKLEPDLLSAKGVKSAYLNKIYLLKRRGFIFKRLIHSMMLIVGHVETFNRVAKSQKQALREEFENSLYYSEELVENASSLLSLHISLSSQKTNEAAQKTNEVMRLLTVLSMFLLPLNVVTGIYGMNFENIPELKWSHGYYVVLGVMLSLIVGTYLWFRSKGWLKG